MRATVSLGIMLLCASIASAAEDTPRPLVGAIRWDAWTGGTITAQVEKTLGPKKYHDRLPWFAEVIDDNTVRIDGSPPAVMNREIEFAATAGLDYWAFLLYPEASPMSTAIRQYLRSPQRKLVNFCLILHNSLKVPPEQWPTERDRAVALLKEEGYQTVNDGRPLVYAFAGGDFPFDRFGEFLRRARAAGLNPYCVFMGWSPAADFARVSDKGFDAVSAYAKPGNQARFVELAESVMEDYWEKAARAKVPYVPLVTTGWDKRPRKDNPVSWEKGHAYHRQQVFPSRATPDEISSHLGRAITFVRSNPSICRAGTIIIYAWNEHDEGGWLSPTSGADGQPDTGRLDAIGAILRKNSGLEPDKSPGTNHPTKEGPVRRKEP